MAGGSSSCQGLSIKLRNDLVQVVELVNDFDRAWSEQCWECWECDVLPPFIQAGKAVVRVSGLDPQPRSVQP